MYRYYVYRHLNYLDLFFMDIYQNGRYDDSVQVKPSFIRSLLRIREDVRFVMYDKFDYEGG